MLGLAWLLAVPVNGVPDERDHVLRAVGAAHGQMVVHGAAAVAGTGGFVTVPKVYDSLMLPAVCFGFNPKVSAGCARSAAGGSELVRSPSGVARYFPLYYLAVGTPSLLTNSALTIYLMRAVALVGAALLVAVAARALADEVATPLGLAGLAVAVTPMAFFLAAGVNSSGWEIAAAIAAWSCGAALLVSDHSLRRDARLIRSAFLSAMLLAVIRGLSPLWVLLIGVVLAASIVPARLVRLLRTTPLPWWMAGIVAVMTVAAIWTLTMHALEVAHQPQNLTLQQRLGISIRATPDRLRQMVGVFGWLDTPAPFATYAAWAAAGGALIVAGFAARSWRIRGGVILTALVSILVPVTLEAATANTYGFAWQGRYGLPMAAGVPILLAVAAGTVIDSWVAARMVRCVAILTGLGQFVALWVVLVRFVSGGAHPLNPLKGSWMPPTGSLTVLLIGAAGCIFWTYAVAGLAEPRPARR